MALWCTDCEKFVPAGLGFCEECGTDLIWGGVPSGVTTTQTVKDCVFCYNFEAMKNADICADCHAAVLDEVNPAEAYPDLCSECLKRQCGLKETVCKPCYALEVWGGELADEPASRGSEYDYWTGYGIDWPADKPVVIPSIAEELETIPARRR